MAVILVVKVVVATSVVWGVFPVVREDVRILVIGDAYKAVPARVATHVINDVAVQTITNNKLIPYLTFAKIVMWVTAICMVMAINRQLPLISPRIGALQW